MQYVEADLRVESESADKTDVYHFGGRFPVARIFWIIGTVPVDNFLLLGVRSCSDWIKHCVLLGC